MKFVLIGQSPAVLAAARVIRSSAAEGEIVIISCDGKLPYDRGLLPRLISRRVKEKELFAEAEEFVRSSGVSLVVDREISRINFNRRRIFLSEKQNLDYDVLVMADAPQVRLPGLKGIRRSGVFHLARLESVKGLVRYLPFVETVVVEVRSLQGLEAALALREQGKDVLVTSDQDRLLAGELDEASGKVLAFLLEKIGIRSILNNAFEDLLGESEVKAVRFRSGKVVACEAVLFDSPPPDLRWLAEGELVLGQRVLVAGNMLTNLPGVYAVDVMCQMESPELIGNYSLPGAEAGRQGEVAARAALGERVVYERTVTAGRVLLESLFDSVQLAEADAYLQAVASGGACALAEVCSAGGPDPAAESGG